MFWIIWLIFSDVDLEKCKETLIHALKKGINYIDTAPYYGHGQSEEVLGKVRIISGKIFWFYKYFNTNYSPDIFFT